MNDFIEIFKRQISHINEIFHSYENLTNDELREKGIQIKTTVSNSPDKNETLNKALPEVYALVKETARRFSLGQVVVMANEYDIWLASNYDFVEIKGNKAIYHNKWDAGGVPFEWNMVHYDEQLLGGILLHYGYAIEMATGEGKTLVATLPVFLNALTHQGVHLMTVNDYLSKRDYHLTHPIYAFHGLTVECIEQYRRYDERRKYAYKCDITFGTNSGFVFDYLFDHLATDPKECVQEHHNFAIIDELDSILIDEANNPHIVSGGIHYNNEEIYKKHFSLIEEIVNDKSKNYYTIDLLNKDAVFTSEGESYISNRLNNKDLFKIRKKYELKDYNLLPEKQREQIMHNINLQNVLHQLLRAYTVFEKDVDYVIQDRAVKIVDPYTGRIKETSRWEHGLHTAIEIKEKVKVQDDSDGIAVISLKNFYKLYNKIAGMSGTIMTAKDELKEIYNLDCSQIPTHNPIIRIDNPLCIFRTSIQKDEAILNKVVENVHKGRPTLIGSLSIKRADAIEKLLSQRKLNFNRLDAMTTKDESLTVSKAGIGNTITLSTSVAGRGTDIKPSQDALINGGLCVIGTDLFTSIRTDLQLKGRTGRQGNPGSSIFFASLEDHILKYLSTEERKELDDIISNINSDDLSCDNVRYYFKLAQTNRENIFKIKRAKEARKDDIIAPHRSKFYKQRNKVLFEAIYADELINDIITEYNININEIEKHLLSLYDKAKELTLRARRNNSNRQQILIPFSDNQHPFTIKYDVNLIQTSLQYFMSEFKRQSILQIYDESWKELVLHMMQDLDQKEIDELDGDYVRMIKNVHQNIINRLQSSSIVFNFIEETSIPSAIINSNQANTEQMRNMAITKDSQCPCGSGKKYCECHGGNIRNIRRRRI